MRVILIFFVISAICHKSLDGFLSFPFLARDALDAFYQVVSANDIVESNIMKSAVYGELCLRPCKKGDIKICHFKFIIKFYQVMSG